VLRLREGGGQGGGRQAGFQQQGAAGVVRRLERWELETAAWVHGELAASAQLLAGCCGQRRPSSPGASHPALAAEGAQLLPSGRSRPATPAAFQPSCQQAAAALPTTPFPPSDSSCSRSPSPSSPPRPASPPATSTRSAAHLRRDVLLVAARVVRQRLLLDGHLGRRHVQPAPAAVLQPQLQPVDAVAARRVHCRQRRSRGERGGVWVCGWEGCLAQHRALVIAPHRVRPAAAAGRVKGQATHAHAPPR
jgi:hypothetical protein